MTTILQLAGLPDTDEIVLETTDETGQKRFLELNAIPPLLDPLHPGRFRHLTLLYGGTENPIRVNIRPDVVYNSIGQPERSSRALERAQHAAKNNTYPFVNHPANIPNVRPDRLCDTVAAIKGITMPKTIRLAPTLLADVKSALAANGMTPPILFKEAAALPEKPSFYLLESQDDLHELERFAFDGRTYYASDFNDYRSADGLCRLYRFFVIGDSVLPGHLIVSDRWHIRDDAEAHSGLGDRLKAALKEEKEFLKSFRKKKFPALQILRKRLGLDYFAAECTFDSRGELLLFKVDCEAHYADGVKAGEYYSADDAARFNEAVETMILSKRTQPKAHHA